MTDTTARTDVTAILAQLTLEEKASLLSGSDFWNTQGIKRLGIPAIMVTDGPHGLRKQTEGADHLGLNASVPATCFPPAAGIASSWNPALTKRIGEALGDECRAADVAVLLGPGLNMKRTPLNGRNFEYFSEDPLLAGALGTGLVQGVQSRGVGTSPKHFAANNQETDRMTISAEIDERTMREIYLPAFEQVVTDAAPWTVMCSYNKIDGVYVSENPWLLSDVLRDAWGYAGLVISDWGAVNERDKAVAAGLDLEMPSSGGIGARRILDAVAAGTLAEEAVDAAVLNVLNLVAKAQQRTPLESFDMDAHHELARQAALQSAVLLKNDDAILPLARTGGPVAVIGAFAQTPRFQGAGSSQVNPTRVDAALDSIEAALRGAREVVFAPGFEIEADAVDDALLADAVAAAKASEVAVVFLGLPPSEESEGYDREHMRLPEAQLTVLDAVATVNPNVVVVLSNGSAVTVSTWETKAKAVLEGWLLGQAGGAATADLLLGTVSPSGKLAETLPVRLEDNPTVGNFPGEHGTVRYGEGLLIGYRWYDAHALPVSYPFGHGLSYTTFEYTDLQVAVTQDGADPIVEVSVTVTNSGATASDEIVQVYVTDPEASVYRPEQELRAFGRVSLEPGASDRVTLTLGRRAFAFWNTPAQAWTVEGGEFLIRVGASSRDIRLASSVTLTGDDVLAPVTAESTAEQFLAHPRAAAWLTAAVTGTEMGASLFDDEHGRMMRAIPLVRLSRFPGAPFSEEELVEAAERASSGR